MPGRRVTAHRLLAPGTSDSAQGVSGHPLWLQGSFTRDRRRCFQRSGVSLKMVVIFGPGIGSREDFSYRGSLASSENLTHLPLYCTARKVAPRGPGRTGVCEPGPPLPGARPPSQPHTCCTSASGSRALGVLFCSLAAAAVWLGCSGKPEASG